MSRPLPAGLQADYDEAEQQPVTALIRLVREVMASHRDKESADYNTCDEDLCWWCELASIAIARIKSGRGGSSV